MANIRLSPAASLLRNSRLFSIPPALSQPASLASDTATQPYPVNAAIETPASSWERGDWGFKRSLPLKSTKGTGTRAIRVQNGIDTAEHITDFESAADHVMTLQKWQELSLPVRFLRKRDQNDRASVFEPTVDNVSANASNNCRWRYDGPWLAGESGMEFDALLKKVKRRKAEFHAVVRAKLETNRSILRRQEATDAGCDIGPEDTKAVTDEDFEQHMQYLRATPSAFGPLIAEFLDLPEGPHNASATRNSHAGFVYGRTTLAADTYQENGPPKTHPSAGISYHRAGAHLYNHPKFGPQQSSPPVFGRILKPNVRKRNGSLGVSGFVVSDGIPSTIAPPSTQWEPVPGGQKVVARPKMAAIDSNGKLRLTVDRVRLVHVGTSDAAKDEEVRQAPTAMGTQYTRMPALDESRAGPIRPKGVDRFTNALGTMMQDVDRENI